MYNVIDIANKVILNTDVEKGDIISNLKLQKLLYYLQGYSFAFFDRPLFEGDLFAWTYGPVSTEAYHRFKEFGAQGIFFDGEKPEEISLEDEEIDMFNQVMHEYGKFSALKLMEMTHAETPWKEVFGQRDNRIKPETMKAFFKTMIDG